MKAEKKDLSFVSPLDWARMAMCIDCEGCIRIGQAVHRTARKFSQRTHYEYGELTIANTNPLLIQWVIATFGGRVYVRKRQQPERWKTAYQWTVACTQAAEIVKGCLPYFPLKREQAEVLLALQATMKMSGLAGTPSSVIQKRDDLRRRMHVLNAKGPKEAVG